MTPHDLPSLDLPPDRAEQVRQLARAAMLRAHRRSFGALWVDRFEPAVCLGFAVGYVGWAVVVTATLTLA